MLGLHKNCGTSGRRGTGTVKFERVRRRVKAGGVLGPHISSGQQERKVDEERVLTEKNKDSDYRTGLICVIACQLIWGFLPVYWQALVPIPSWIIILYRMTTMFVYTYIAARLKYSREEIWAPLKEKGTLARYLVAGLLLTANWSTYIWAMTTGHMVQASIGYYLEPIVICLFGVVIFKEKFTK